MGWWEEGWSKDTIASLAFADVLVGRAKPWPVTKCPRVLPLFPGGINLTETVAWLRAAQLVIPLSAHLFSYKIVFSF